MNNETLQKLIDLQNDGYDVEYCFEGNGEPSTLHFRDIEVLTALRIVYVNFV